MDGGRDDLLRVGQRAVRLSVITTRRSTLHSHAENSNKSTRTKQRRNSNRAANLANTVSPAIHMRLCSVESQQTPDSARFRQIPPEPSFRGTAYAGYAFQNEDDALLRARNTANWIDSKSTYLAGERSFRRLPQREKRVHFSRRVPRCRSLEIQRSSLLVSPIQTRYSSIQSEIR